MNSFNINHEIILKCNNIKRSFTIDKKIKLEVLKGISLEVYRGEILVIIGASGAGKSTLLHILGTIDRPDEGTLTIYNTDVFKLKDEEISKFRNRYIGFVFQFHHLLPEFTALENVMIPMIINQNNFYNAKTKSIELLNKVGLEKRINHKPSELSGGEQQRVAVARALANSPELIFADEPSGNLDSVNSEMLHNLIRRLNEEEKQTFVIVTHNQNLMDIAHRVFEIKDGILSAKEKNRNSYNHLQKS